MTPPSDSQTPAFDSPHHLGPQYRRLMLGRLRDDQFDVLIVGGGITGMGCALDAVSRGLRVAVLEQRDIASGTSSRSSKLIHGGLRYLEQLNFRLVREALRERSLLLTRLAPHLVSPVQFLYPLRHRFWERWYVGAGILLYDMLAKMGGNPLPGHRHLSRTRALEEIPALAKHSLVGGIQYYDTQVDDARHTLAVARTAAALGAAVGTSLNVSGLIRADGRVTGATVTCLETGEVIDVRARHVINATGVWTDDIESMAGRSGVDVTASKGVHLVVPRDRIAGRSGMIVRTKQSVLFVIPWGRHWLIGTTDTAWNLDLAHPAASVADIDYLLGEINQVLEVPLTTADIEGVFAGLRPLLSGESDSTSKLSREHGVWHTAPGLTTVAGGKYTTYRVMAEDTVDTVVTDLGGGAPASTTADLPLLGADGFQELWDRRVELADEAGLQTEEIERLLRRHGGLTQEVLAIIAARPDLAQPLPGSPDYLLAEAFYAVVGEGALHLDDVLTRRTRISVESWDRGVSAGEAIAPLMAELLGWDDAAVARELEHYRARVAAERESQTMSDDHTADAARLGAPDVRRLGK